jgi:hypothetical protein
MVIPLGCWMAERTGSVASSSGAVSFALGVGRLAVRKQRIEGPGMSVHDFSPGTVKYQCFHFLFRMIPRPTWQDVVNIPSRGEVKVLVSFEASG